VKKILGLSIAIVLVIGLVAGGTWAYFSDTETTTGNVFTAGTIDISLDPTGGQDVFTVDGEIELKPCQTGYIYVCVNNDGDNPCEVWKHIANVENREHGTSDAEQKYYNDNPGSDTWLMSNWIHYDLFAFRSLGYSAAATSETYSPYKPNGADVDITVADGNCAVTWTFDWPIDSDAGNGNMGNQLVISLDGVHPAYQIHNNDGTCAAFPWGTWLYSPWDPTMGGYNGWHTSDAAWNTPVADMNWIEATGDRYHDNNSEGIFTVTIDKCRLVPEFWWAAHFGGGGFWDYGGLSKYPVAWTPWSGDATAFEYANIAVQTQQILESEGLTLTGSNFEGWVECFYIYLGVLEPGESMCVIQSYHLDADVENWAQTDRVFFDMEFFAQQSEGEPPPTPPANELPGHGK
jgi:predicted ribosomally synthesized peptide with SipW-like signal peptide